MVEVGNWTLFILFQNSEGTILDHEFRVGHVCSENELLTAIIINEVEAERMSVEIRDGKARGPEAMRIVRSIFYPQSSFSEDDPGEIIWCE